MGEEEDEAVEMEKVLVLPLQLLAYGSYWRSRSGLSLGFYQGLLSLTSARFVSWSCLLSLPLLPPSLFSARRIEVKASPLPPCTTTDVGGIMTDMRITSDLGTGSIGQAVGS